MRERVDWNTFWMSMVYMISRRSIDNSTKHGAIIVDKNNKLISMGYNSFPRNCDDEKLPLTRPEKYNVIPHAELNAIVNSCQNLHGCTVYVSGLPCTYCFSNMINAGIERIIYGHVGSNCISEKDVELLKEVNKRKDGKEHIMLIRFEDIGNLNDVKSFFDEVKDYIVEKEINKVFNG